jgi:hypothetical protein
VWERRGEGTTGRVLAELQATVARLREEVQAMRALVDQLLAWVRSCPNCQAVLRKEDPRMPWRCQCGWTSG